MRCPFGAIVTRTNPLPLLPSKDAKEADRLAYDLERAEFTPDYSIDSKDRCDKVGPVAFDGRDAVMTCPTHGAQKLRPEIWGGEAGEPFCVAAAAEQKAAAVKAAQDAIEAAKPKPPPAPEPAVEGAAP